MNLFGFGLSLGGGKAASTGGGAGNTVPVAPTIGTATAGVASASVSFTPGSNGGSPITGFTVTSSPGGLTGTGSSSPIAVSGLTNGTAYTFTVHATNAIGNSSESAASNSVTPTGASGTFVPLPGFSVTAVGGSFGHGLPFIVSRSSGSWPAHANYNKGGGTPLTYFGNPFLCFIAKSFEGTSIGTNLVGAALTGGIERSRANGGADNQWQIVSDAPANLTRSARRQNIDARTDPLELTLTSNPATIYQSVKMKPSSAASSGKFSRLFGDNGDFWLATGGDDTYIRGSDDANYTAYGGYPGNVQLSSVSWNQQTWSFDQVHGKISVSVNGKVQWFQPGGPFTGDLGNNTAPWTNGNINPSGHTLNLCDERDNTGDYIDFADWFVDLTFARFVMGDASSIASCTRLEFQVPLANNGGWTTSDVALGMNTGELPSYIGAYLYAYDTLENLTPIGYWQP